MKLSIIVPAYNERKLVEKFWSHLKTAPIKNCRGVSACEIVIVDDGSTDGTTELLAQITKEEFVFNDGTPALVHFLQQGHNQGKGAAVRRGIENSTGDIVLIQDADLEYSPQNFPDLTNPIADDLADAVYGSRFAGHTRRVLMFWHTLANKFLTLCSNVVLDVNFTDMETCYKAVRGNLARSLKLTSNRFGIEPEITSRLAHARARLYEVPINYHGRTYDEGKKIGAKDGIAALWHIFKFGFIDVEAFKAGLSQTLGVLDRLHDIVYRPLLARALNGLPLPKKRLNILEIGCGIGSMTAGLADLGHVVAADISKDFVEQTSKRFASNEDVTPLVWDATQPLPQETKPETGFDLIVCFNVLEHIENEMQVLDAWHRLLTPEGHLIILVPNYPFLFSQLDRAAGHYRRYSKLDLKQKVESVGLDVKQVYTGNSLGILGWFVNKLMGKEEIGRHSLKIYAVLKRLLGPVEKRVDERAGLSVIAVARRKPV